MSRVYNPAAIKKDTKPVVQPVAPPPTPVKTSSRIVMRRVEEDDPDPNDENAVKAAIKRDNDLMNRFFESGRRGYVDEDVLKKKLASRQVYSPSDEQRIYDAAFSSAEKTVRSNLTEDETIYRNIKEGEQYKPVINVQMDELACEEFRYVLGQMRGIPFNKVKEQINYKIMPNGHVEYYALMDDNSWKRIWDNRKLSLTESERIKMSSGVANTQLPRR